MKKFLTIILVILGILVIVNLGVLDWTIFRSENGNWPTSSAWRQDGRGEEVEDEDKIASPSCELSCQKIIEEKIKEELADLPLSAGGSSVTPANAVKIPTQTLVSNEKKILYIPLINEGSVVSSNWTDVLPSEFYFNLADYSKAKEVRFLAYLSSSNNDPGYARIYDVTNNRGVDFSDLLFNKNDYTLVESSSLVIWRGNNKYTIQLRSANGTKVFIKDAKLKIIY